MIRTSASVVLAGLVAACAPHAMWMGTDPARYRRAELISGNGEQWVRVGPEEGPHFQAIGADGIVFSPDAKRIAYAAFREGRWVVVIDGQMSGPWDDAAEPVFSADGVRAAFLAKSHRHWRAVVDGIPGPDFPLIQPDTLHFSANGRHAGFVAVEGNCAAIVIDGVAGTCREGVVSLRVSDDGAPAAVVREGGRYRFLLGTALGPAFDGIGQWAATDDGTRSAYAARNRDRWYAVIDGKLEAPRDAVRQVRFGDGGHRVAWVEAEGQWAWVAVDGNSGPHYRSIAAPLLAAHAPDFAYAARDETAAWVVSDEKRRGPFTEVSDVALSPDGRGLAFVHRSAGKTWVFHSVKGPDGHCEEAHGADEAIPRVPCVAPVPSEHDAPVDVIVPGTLVLSDDGEHWAAVCGERNDRRLWVSIDGNVARNATADDVFGDDTSTLRPWVERVLREALGRDRSVAAKGSP
jgi:hypothetical protein